jgi:stage II sporulation protein AA (anti-sigma F factor antagonist)
MAIAIERSGDVLVLLPQGRLDSNNAAAVETEILGHVSGGENRLVLDFSGLEYISSAGLRVVLVVAKRLKQAGGTLVLCALPAHIREVFEISGFLSILQATDTRAEALAAAAG